MQCLTDPAVDAWALSAEVQAAARAHLLSVLKDGEQLLNKFDAPVFGTRLMNFRVLDATNQLFWSCERLDAFANNVGSRSDFNALATMPQPQCLRALPLLALTVGFRPEGELSAPRQILAIPLPGR